MTAFTHPITGIVYETDDGAVVIVRETDGREGRFDSRGRWQSGDVKYADAHSCNFVSRRMPGQS